MKGFAYIVSVMAMAASIAACLAQRAEWATFFMVASFYARFMAARFESLESTTGLANTPTPTETSTPPKENRQ